MGHTIREGKYKETARPVLINSWEASYFDFTGESLLKLAEQAAELGIELFVMDDGWFGCRDSELYREHPDWAFVILGRKPDRSRYQLVLDFSRKEVVDYIYGQICSVLDQGNVEYIKWDMNRSLTDIYSAAADSQGSVLYDYMMWVYDFLERLVNRYPNLLIEGCSGSACVRVPQSPDRKMHLPAHERDCGDGWNFWV